MVQFACIKYLFLFFFSNIIRGSCPTLGPAKKELIKWFICLSSQQSVILPLGSHANKYGKISRQCLVTRKDFWKEGMMIVALMWHDTKKKKEVFEMYISGRIWNPILNITGDYFYMSAVIDTIMSNRPTSNSFFYFLKVDHWQRDEFQLMIQDCVFFVESLFIVH